MEEIHVPGDTTKDRGRLKEREEMEARLVDATEGEERLRGHGPGHRLRKLIYLVQTQT